VKLAAVNDREDPSKLLSTAYDLLISADQYIQDRKRQDEQAAADAERQANATIIDEFLPVFIGDGIAFSEIIGRHLLTRTAKKSTTAPFISGEKGLQKALKSFVEASPLALFPEWIAPGVSEEAKIVEAVEARLQNILKDKSIPRYVFDRFVAWRTNRFKPKESELMSKGKRSAKSGK
jgi:hypothetical protein